jgi:hypothetical protein
MRKAAIDNGSEMTDKELNEFAEFPNPVTSADLSAVCTKCGTR